ncbi:MAG: DUF357 domain-containing protein [Methanoregula sp.]
MKITECQTLFTSALSTTRIPAPESTHYNRTAALVLEMARAYESDGIRFSESGDPVNALASYYYGFGWLHFGVSSGLLTVMHPTVCPLKDPLEILKPPFRAKLEEKTSRYAHLLNTARTSVACAPDPATTSGVFASQLLCVAGVYARRGFYLMQSGKPEDALASFSYGHGWLDAGVTAGFFRILAERDLFTV